MDFFPTFKSFASFHPSAAKSRNLIHPGILNYDTSLMLKLVDQNRFDRRKLENVTRSGPAMMADVIGFKFWPQKPFVGILMSVEDYFNFKILTFFV